MDLQSPQGDSGRRDDQPMQPESQSQALGEALTTEISLEDSLERQHTHNSSNAQHDQQGDLQAPDFYGLDQDRFSKLLESLTSDNNAQSGQQPQQDDQPSHLLQTELPHEFLNEFQEIPKIDQNSSFNASLVGTHSDVLGESRPLPTQLDIELWASAQGGFASHQQLGFDTTPVAERGPATEYSHQLRAQTYGSNSGMYIPNETLCALHTCPLVGQHYATEFHEHMGICDDRCDDIPYWGDSVTTSEKNLLPGAKAFNTWRVAKLDARKDQPAATHCLRPEIKVTNYDMMGTCKVLKHAKTLAEVGDPDSMMPYLHHYEPVLPKHINDDFLLHDTKEYHKYCVAKALQAFDENTQHYPSTRAYRPADVDEEMSEIRWQEWQAEGMFTMMSLVHKHRDAYYVETRLHDLFSKVWQAHSQGHVQLPEHWLASYCLKATFTERCFRILQAIKSFGLVRADVVSGNIDALIAGTDVYVALKIANFWCNRYTRRNKAADARQARASTGRAAQDGSDRVAMEDSVFNYAATPHTDRSRIVDNTFQPIDFEIERSMNSSGLGPTNHGNLDYSQQGLLPNLDLSMYEMGAGAQPAFNPSLTTGTGRGLDQLGYPHGDTPTHKRLRDPFRHYDVGPVTKAARLDQSGAGSGSYHMQATESPWLPSAHSWMPSTGSGSNLHNTPTGDPHLGYTSSLGDVASTGMQFTGFDSQQPSLSLDGAANQSQFDEGLLRDLPWPESPTLGLETEGNEFFTPSQLQDQFPFQDDDDRALEDAAN